MHLGSSDQWSDALSIPPREKSTCRVYAAINSIQRHKIKSEISALNPMLSLNKANGFHMMG